MNREIILSQLVQLDVWKEKNLYRPLPDWEQKMKTDNAALFAWTPTQICIAFPDFLEAVKVWKQIHHCSLSKAVETIRQAEDKLSIG